MSAYQESVNALLRDAAASLLHPPTPRTLLSDRIRPNSEAAPWVVEEVKQLERGVESAKTLNRSLLDQLEAKDAQIEALRDAVEKLRDSLEVGKDSVATWDWCTKMLANLQPPAKP